MKNKICYLLSIIIFLNFIFIPYNASAKMPTFKNNYIIYQYVNNKSSNDKIKFEIYSTDKTNFKGHLQVKDNSGAVNFDDDVSGTIKYFADHFKCYCEFKTTWIFGIKYNSNALIDVYPFKGTAKISFGGEGWIATMEKGVII